MKELEEMLNAECNSESPNSESPNQFRMSKSKCRIPNSVIRFHSEFGFVIDSEFGDSDFGIHHFELNCSALSTQHYLSDCRETLKIQRATHLSATFWTSPKGVSHDTTQGGPEELEDSTH